MNQNLIPEIDDLRSAMGRIKGFVHHTPVLESSFLNDLTGGRLFFKCENFQKIGAFKIRGATNAMRSLPLEEIKNGVCTHSSGNHAQAVAFAARSLGVAAHIVMPNNAPEVKREAVAGYGAHIYMCEPNQMAREAMAKEVMQNTGACFLHPYDDIRIVAGQSTAAIELLEEVVDLNFLLAPIGGGGLVGGTALAANYFSRNTKVVACEPEGADDAFRSFRDGIIYPSDSPKTIADGLLTSVGEINFKILKRYVHEVVTCSEESILKAMRLIWERMKIIIEPSSAVPLACILENKIDVAGRRVGIILSGGNVDLSKLPF